MMYLFKFYRLMIVLCALSIVANAQAISADDSLFKGDASGVLLNASEKTQEVSCEGIDTAGNSVFAFTLFPSLRHQIKTKDGNPLGDGVYYCRCVVKYQDGKSSPDPGRLTKSLGQITYISGIHLYNQGKTDEAADVFKRTVEAFPKESSFWLCWGAVCYKRSKMGEATEEQRRQQSQYALVAYTKALEFSGNNCAIKDNSIGYIATIYDELGDEARNREWLLKRTIGNCATSEIKAGTFYAVGVKYWQCAYDISTRYANKRRVSSEPFHTRNFYYKPDKDKFDDCLMNAFKYLEQALAVNPNYAEAWSYKSLLYREKQKSTASRVQQKQFEREAEKAAKTAIEMTARQREREK